MQIIVVDLLCTMSSSRTEEESGNIKRRAYSVLATNGPLYGDTADARLTINYDNPNNLSPFQWGKKYRLILEEIKE